MNKAQANNGWQPIKSVPLDQAIREFLMPDGAHVRGAWAPYWCGEDCPCDVDGEQEWPHRDEPECWCLYPAGEKFGLEASPTHWREAA